jgi:peptidoglycan/LPS O-acetylase OafA/YrhL
MSIHRVGDGSGVDVVESVGDPTTADRHAFAYQPALDGMRALAVLAVIAYHNGYDWAVGGFLGVDAFFVLSGFLITTLLVLEYRRADSIGLVAFWGRRLRRLLPALLLVLLFCAVYARVLLDPLEIGGFRWDALSSLFYVTNWRFIASGQSYFDVFSTASPVRHLWSLAIEEQFYLVWPIVTLACLRVRRGRTDLLAAVCVAGAVASAVAMAVLYDPASPSRAYYGTDTRVHTILIGALLALVMLRRQPRRAGARHALQVAGAIALVVILWTWTTVDATSAGYYGLGSVAYALGVAVLIAATVQPVSMLGRSLGVQPLRGIGRISYGLYLWHWPIIVWLPHWRVGFGDSRLVALRLVITFALAGLSYVFVESPIRHGRWFPRGGRSTRLVAPVAFVVAAAILLVSSVGATALPSYLVGFQEPCPAVRASEIDAARTQLREQPIPAPRRTPEIAVIGDSVVCSLTPALDALEERGRWHFRVASIIGCGIVSNEVTVNNEMPIIPGLTEHCASATADASRAALQGHVPVALWLSTWERADLVVDGHVVHAGTAAWRRVLLERYDAAIARMHRAGTHVVLATMPSTAPARLLSLTSRPKPVTDRAYRTLDDLLATVASRHPEDVTLLDLEAFVCPGRPPCPRTRDGIAPRSIDGMHYTPEGAVWVLRWLLPRILLAEMAARPGA